MSRPMQIASAGVSVTFTPAGDRFTQRIEIAGAALLAVDEDAESAETWPPSPPLQDVHLEQRSEGRQLALMIGRAGLSHWSISCELDSSAGEVLFDVACRIKEPAAWLGSTYQLPPGVTFSGDEHSGELRMDEHTICRISADHDCEISWHAESKRLVFLPRTHAEVPAMSEGNSFPRTIRWRYRLLVVESNPR